MKRFTRTLLLLLVLVQSFDTAAALAPTGYNFRAVYASSAPASAQRTHRRRARRRASGRYYTNVEGRRVHSPVFARSAPAGATARCADGSYSFSRHRRGTCSHHGGVAVWY
jgi:Protein of unknown function (DUF3761)